MSENFNDPLKGKDPNEPESAVIEVNNQSGELVKTAESVDADGQRVIDVAIGNQADEYVPSVEECYRHLKAAVTALRKHHNVIIYSLRFKWKVGHLAEIFVQSNQKNAPRKKVRG